MSIGLGRKHAFAVLAFIMPVKSKLQIKVDLRGSD
jgi:hypothetical protein